MSSSATKPMVWYGCVCGLMDSTHINAQHTHSHDVYVVHIGMQCLDVCKMCPLLYRQTNSCSYIMYTQINIGTQTENAYG